MTYKLCRKDFLCRYGLASYAGVGKRRKCGAEGAKTRAAQRVVEQNERHYENINTILSYISLKSVNFVPLFAGREL